MERKSNNPLTPLADVQLSKEEQIQMLAELQAIMEEEEAVLPSPKPHWTTFVPSWVKTGIAGAAAVIMAGVVFFGVLSRSTVTTAHHQPPAPKPPVTVQHQPSFRLSHFDAGAFDAVSFLDDKVGFVAGKDGIYKTTNGGQTWAIVYTSRDPILGIKAEHQPDGKDEYVVAWTKTYLVRSRDGGEHFTEQGVGGNTDGSGTNIEGVSLLSDGLIYLLNNGVVWETDGDSGALFRSTPTDKVSSISVTWDANGAGVCYAVAGTSVYKTIDSGHWTKLFTAPVQAEQFPWEARVEANGSHVWLLVEGGQRNQKTGEEAYVIFASNDGGSTWQPMVANQNYTTAYPSVHLPPAQNIGQEPLSMGVLSTGEVVFASRDTVVGKILISEIGPGITNGLRGPLTSTNQANAFDTTSPVGIFFTDQNHGWVVGSNQGKGYVYSTDNGGNEWIRR